jgi:hypothetical protein
VRRATVEIDGLIIPRRRFAVRRASIFPGVARFTAEKNRIQQNKKYK